MAKNENVSNQPHQVIDHTETFLGVTPPPPIRTPYWLVPITGGTNNSLD